MMTIQEAKQIGPALVRLFTTLGMIHHPNQRDMTACVLAALGMDTRGKTVRQISGTVGIDRASTGAIVYRLVRDGRVRNLGGNPKKYAPASVNAQPKPPRSR